MVLFRWSRKYLVLCFYCTLRLHLTSVLYNVHYTHIVYLSYPVRTPPKEIQTPFNPPDSPPHNPCTPQNPHTHKIHNPTPASHPISVETSGKKVGRAVHQYTPEDRQMKDFQLPKPVVMGGGRLPGNKAVGEIVTSEMFVYAINQILWLL